MTLFIDESEGYARKVVGGILVPNSSIHQLEEQCVHKRFSERLFGELKWERGKTPYHTKYKSFVDTFFEDGDITFHCYTYTNKRDKFKVAYAMVRSVCRKLWIHGDDTSLNILFDEGNTNEVNRIHEYLTKDHYVHQTINFCTTANSAVLGGLQISDLLNGYVASTINEKEKNMDEGKRELREYIYDRNGGHVAHLPWFPELYEFKMHRFDPQKYVYDKNRE